MRRIGLLVAVVLAIASDGTRAAPATPVIVEFFASEGRKDCPAADTVLDKMAAAQPAAGADFSALIEDMAAAIQDIRTNG